MILRMLFLKISNIDILSGEKTLTWKFYITNKALPITKWVYLINIKEFIIVVLDVDSKIFVVHMAI